METIPIRVTYLEMFERPERVLSPPTGTTIMQAVKPTVRFYRFIHRAVGQDWNWVQRQEFSDEQLVRIIHDDRVEVHVLYVDGSPAGFAELDRRVQGEVQLMYFGLMAEFFGRGLGRYFLHWTIEQAWSYQPKRVWVHTCTRDHPAALPLYRNAGFRVFDERQIDHALPPDDES